MPDVLPTINNEPAQGIQALLDTVYLWNQDVANELIEQINELLEELGDFADAGCIKPYSELTAPVRQYLPCYNGDNVYVAAADIETLPEQFNPSQWILIATKAPVLQAGAGIDINGNEISVEQQVLSDAAAGGTAVQPGDLGTAAYAATTDFATAAQGILADTAVQPADLATVATSGSYTDLSNKPAIDGVTLTSQTTKADIGLAGVYKYKGSVATYADLANVQNPDVGDVYNVEDTGDNYAWSGTEWDQLGGTFVPPVTSVNSKTGAVVLDAKDVGAIPQYSTMPVASVDHANKIVQYSGVTNANYTNGYFYKCVSDGQSPATYSWEQVDVQPNPDKTPNKISHTFMYDEDNPTSIANIRLKEGETAKLKIRAYEAFDNGEGEITPGSELFDIDVFLDDAKNLLDGNSGNSRCFYVNLWNVGYLSCDIHGTYDGYYQLWSQCYGEYEPDEKKYSIFEIEYSDGVDSFEFSAEEGGYVEVATGYTGLNPTGCRQEFPDFFEDYAPGGIMPVIEAGGTMTWKKYPFGDLYTGVDNQILVTESGGFANKWVSQVYDMTMPEEPALYLDPVAIFQYLGETDQDYTQGYFYKIATVGQRNATIISTQGSALGNITIDQDKFADFLKSEGVYWSGSDYIRMVGTSYNVSWEFRGLGFTKSELEDTLGISYDGYASNGDYIELGWDDATFEWQQVNTQPEPVIPDPLPSQTGQSGKFLTTNGTSASWGNALTNTATDATSLAILGSSIAYTYTVVTGYNASATWNYATVYGASASAGSHGTAIGSGASVTYAGVAVGANAHSSAYKAIQIGEGTNSDINTLKVANENGNFEMMSANGTIPTARFTTDPVSDGTYIPTVTLSSGTAARSWEAPTTITFRVWGANE